MLRSALALAAVAAAVLLPTASASAAPIYEVEYEVDLNVTATWGISQTDEEDYPKRYFTGDATASFTAHIDNVLFRNGQLLAVQPTGPVAAPTMSGGGTATRIEWDSVHQREITTRGTCSTSVQPAAGLAYIKRAADQPYPNEESLDIRLTEALAGGFTHCTALSGPATNLAFNAKPFPEAVFDVDFTLPHEAIGMGKIIQNVSAPVANRSPQFCPGVDAYTSECEFNWTGQLVFTKVGEWQYGVETPGGGQQQTPAPPFDPRADAISRAVEQYGTEPFDPRADAIRRAVEQYGAEPAFDPRAQIISDAVAQYGRELRFRAGCEKGCAGTAVITRGKRAYAARSANRGLATVRFKVPAGKPRLIKVKLPAKARAALRRAGRRAQVRITLRPRSGRAVTTTLRLRRAR